MRAHENVGILTVRLPLPYLTRPSSIALHNIGSKSCKSGKAKKDCVHSHAAPIVAAPVKKCEFVKPICAASSSGGKVSLASFERLREGLPERPGASDPRRRLTGAKMSTNQHHF